MFFKKFAQGDRYVYLVPESEGVAAWEEFDQEELDRRIEENLLAEGCRLFRIDREIKVSFERVTHLE